MITPSNTFKPGLIIRCNTDTFFVSKMVGSQFAYFSGLLSTEEEDVDVDAHDDFFTVF